MKLRIQNFQAHKDTTIEFDRITTIVGPSDTGKSAVLRALKWVAKNEPKGTSFIRDGEKEATVTLSIDGHTIERKRSKTNNSYTLDGMELKAFGNEVPEDVSRILNLGDLTFQGQHDSPLWFVESAGEVSRRLNSIVDLSLIDSSLSNIDSVIREQRWRVQEIEKKKDKIKEDGMSLKWSVEAHKKILEIFAQKEALEKDNRIAERIETLLENAQRRKEDMESYEIPLRLAEKAVALGIKWQEVDEKCDDLESKIKKIERLTRYLDRMPALTKAVEMRLHEWEDLANKVNGLRNIIERIERQDNLCNNERKVELENLENRYRKLLGSVCPLCGNPIKS